MKKLSEKRLDAEHIFMLENTPDEEDGLRQARVELLDALDVYEKNVLRGYEAETAEEQANVRQWRQDLLDKKREAFSPVNVPPNVAKYRKRKEATH